VLKKVGLAAAVTLASGALSAFAAYAADIVHKAHPAPVAPVAPYNWTGFYAGANFGGLWTDSTLTNANTGISHKLGGAGFLGGLQAGYNYQFGNIVLGVEGEFDWASHDPGLALNIPMIGVSRFSHEVNWVSTVAARFGFGFDRWLTYGKAGAGWFNSSSSVAIPGVANWQSTDTQSGWLLGGGIEYAFASSWTAKLEYSYLKLGDETLAGTMPLSVSRDVQFIKAGLNYRFGYSAPMHAQANPGAGPGAGPSTEDLARASQNPVAAMISLPFQNNTNFNTGRYGRAQNVLNIQPVIPMSLNGDWNIISRTIVPVISQPNLFSDANTGGMGDITQSLFLSPANPGHVIWGVGPVFTAPSASDTILGNGKTLFGATAVALIMPGHWVIGVLANNQWSVAGDPYRKPVNTFLAQPFVNYNMAGGWFLTYSPIITADWLAPSDQRWTVPVGGGFGRVFKVGEQPVNASLSGYYNVVRPDSAGDWQLRAQVAFLFPR
jgi:opacity protein-like surface antigen